MNHLDGPLGQIKAAKHHIPFIKGKIFVDVGTVPVAEHFLYFIRISAAPELIRGEGLPCHMESGAFYITFGKGRTESSGAG